MKENSDTLVLYDNRLFSPEDFCKKGIETETTFRQFPFIFRVVRRIFESLNFTQKYWYGDWKKRLPFVKNLIIFAPCELARLKYIKQVNKDIRIIYWFWNSVSRTGLPAPTVSKLTEIWSFDPDDCNRFGFKYNTTFYFDNILLEQNTPNIDALFLGNNKGRRQYLQELERLFSKCQITSRIHIVPDKNEIVEAAPKEIPYKDYLLMLSKAKAIIDIPPIGQSGLTVRPMESIFLKKKLITNDPSISSQDFYNPNNIFILGKDDENSLQLFINSPYSPLDQNIVASYDVVNWLKRFDL